MKKIIHLIGLMAMVLISGCITIIDVIPGGRASTVSVSGTKFKRGGKKFRIIGKSLDWANQPIELKDFKKLVDNDSKIGINLYFAFGSPGLSKPLFAPNGSGSPYSNQTTLKRNSKYWDEVLERMDYANRNGITVVVANTFVDQGVFGKYGKQVVMDDWMNTVKTVEDSLVDRSVMYVPMSEYDERSSAERMASVEMSNWTRNKVKDPVSLHSVNSSSKDVNAIDFIIHQGWNLNKIKSDLNYGKPVIIAEDQSAANNDDLKIKRFQDAEAVGATYIFTGNNFGFSDKLKSFIKSL